MSQTAPATTETPFAYSGKLTIAVNVSDLDRSIAWYRDVLGFELEYRLENMAWCEMRTPVRGVTVGLGQSEDVKPTEATTPTFGVADIDAARTHLESHGVRFDGDTYDVGGMVRLATFYDPDGNSYMLAQVLGERTA